jgi:Flp pilus assembly protein TadD
LKKARDFRRALADFRKVLATEAGDSRAWNLVGICEANLGNTQSALQAYDKALELDPAYKEALLNKASGVRVVVACRAVHQTTTSSPSIQHFAG